VWRLAPAWAGRMPPLRGAVAEVTHIIDLTDGADAALVRWSAPAARQARRAARDGAAVREATDNAAWAAYDALYRQSLRRWSRPTSVYDAGFFRALRRHAGAEARLFLAERDRRAVAGALVLTAGSHASYWHGASAPGAAPGAANLLQREIVLALAAGGFAVYDLNPSGGHEGVRRFKASIGAREAPAPIVTRHRPREALIARAREWTARRR